MIDYRQLLIKYMARVIDIESKDYIELGISYAGIEFEPKELEEMLSMEKEAVKLLNEALNSRLEKKFVTYRKIDD